MSRVAPEVVLLVSQGGSTGGGSTLIYAILWYLV